METLIKQIMKFGIVGVIAFIIDYGTLYMFVEFFNINYLLAAALSFAISVIFNYIASMAYVFKRRNDMSKNREFVIFVFLSLIGLLINQIIMWICVEKISIFYMLAKIFATTVVMIWNFISRKMFLEG